MEGSVQRSFERMVEGFRGDVSVQDALAGMSRSDLGRFLIEGNGCNGAGWGGYSAGKSNSKVLEETVMRIVRGESGDLDKERKAQMPRMAKTLLKNLQNRKARDCMHVFPVANKSRLRTKARLEKPRAKKRTEYVVEHKGVCVSGETASKTNRSGLLLEEHDTKLESCLPAYAEEDEIQILDCGELLKKRSKSTQGRSSGGTAAEHFRSLREQDTFGRREAFGSQALRLEQPDN
uniref:Uncharacterized protein n=1 Tax=Mucochytrium quahogii TaxID=96639 RepID=A0A7S2WRT2_9STRA